MNTRHEEVKRSTAAWEALNICRLLYPWRATITVVPKPTRRSR